MTQPMSTRYYRNVAHFRQPFRLTQDGDDWPAGDYLVDTERTPSGSAQDDTETVKTMLSALNDPFGNGRLPPKVTIDASDLAEALAKDGRPVERAENEGMTVTPTADI